MLAQQNSMEECSDDKPSFSGPMLNKIQIQSSRFKSIITQLRLSKRRSMGESAAIPFHIQNQCEISNIEPVSEKLDKNSFELDLPADLPIKRNTLMLKNKQSDKQIGDSGLKYKPRGAINGRDDIRVRNLSDIHKNITVNIRKQKGEERVSSGDHQNLQLALNKLDMLENPQSSYFSQLMKQSRSKFTSPISKNGNSNTMNSRIHNQTDRPSKNSRHDQSRISKKQQNLMIQPKELLQYLRRVPNAKHPSANCSPSKIYDFFMGICTNMGIADEFDQPLIKRYRNCVYFGHKVPANSHRNSACYIGFVWYFRQALYYGQFQKGRKNGYGIEIDMEDPSNQCIWRGTFENGKKTGYFQLTSQKMEYNGTLSNSYFDGEGMLNVKGHSIYKGTFLAGMKDGFGVETFTKSSLCYKGQYNQNKFQGTGQLQGPDFYYKGQFKNGKAHGQGFQRTSQFQYHGSFKNGKKSGVGKLKFKDGDVHQGRFQNGQLVNPINHQSPSQYSKSIKIQSVRKFEEQSSMAPSSILATECKIKPPSTLRQQSQKIKPQNLYDRIIPLQPIPISNLRSEVASSRIAPLQKHLSSRLKSLCQENENEQATIDQINRAHLQRNYDDNRIVQLTKVEESPYQNRPKRGSLFTQYEKQIDEAEASDDEDEPLGIKVLPRD